MFDSSDLILLRFTRGRGGGSNVGFAARQRAIRSNRGRQLNKRVLSLRTWSQKTLWSPEIEVDCDDSGYEPKAAPLTHRRVNSLYWADLCRPSDVLVFEVLRFSYRQ